jgi:oligosaccharide repeat unit polymerase
LTNGALPSTCYGEMFANFGFTGIIVGMFIFGLLLAKLNNLLLKFNNLYYLIIYSLIVSSFVFIYPKGEFDNLNLIGLIIFSMTFIFIILGSKLFKKNLFK